MLNLFCWEIKGFAKGKRLSGYIIVTLVSALVFVAVVYVTEVPNGLLALIEGTAFYSSALVFFCPIFAGMMIAQAFEDRLIQAAIMSGKSRFSIVLVKTSLFTLATFIYLLVAAAVSTGVFTLIKGWGAENIGINIGSLILRLIGFMLMSAVGYSIVVPLVFYSKRVGSSIGLGFVVSLLLYSLTQELVKNPSLHSVLQLTPLGRSFFIMDGKGFAYAVMNVMIIAVWFFTFVLFSWLLIRNEELK